MNIAELSKILQDNGIVGAGGAGFPTYAKLSDKAEIILMNCAECEPLLKLHRQLLKEHTYEILQAFHLIAETVGAKQAIIGIKEEYKSTIGAVNQYIGQFSEMSIHELPGAYPMGDEVVLIYEATGRQVKPGGLPIQSGVAVFNVETLYNVYRAVWENKPVTEKYITVVGEVENSITVKVPVGVKLKNVVELAGKIKIKDPVYLVGGPMMGFIGNENMPVTKTTNAVLILPPKHPLILKRQTSVKNALSRAASSCCQCETCTALCPRHCLGHPIEPHKFMRAAANRDFQDISAFLDTMYCSSCGLCELYSCPQGLSPRSIMAEYKAELRKAGIKPEIIEDTKVNPKREYRKVPEGRLTARLGLAEYDKDALLNDELVMMKNVRINLSQHIGAPAKAIVKVGDYVKKDDIIAMAENGLSVNIHSSVDGKVKIVTDKYIEIA